MPRLHLIAILALLHVQVAAQRLPPPSRTVYKCEVAGKTVYSDSPCEGAKRIDVQPTRGLNKSSGTERIGDDVRAERHNELMADALRPVLGETAEERAVRHRRAKLKPDQARRCYELDREIADAEAQEHSASTADLKAKQSKLFALRQSFRTGHC